MNVERCLPGVGQSRVHSPQAAILYKNIYIRALVVRGVVGNHFVVPNNEMTFVLNALLRNVIIYFGYERWIIYHSESKLNVSRHSDLTKDSR